MSSNQVPVISQETLKASGVLSLQNEQVKKSVFVRNISGGATVKDIADFFSLSGDVEKIIMDRDPNSEGKQFAVVVFSQEHAYSTALLLGQATIVDSEIVVYPYSRILYAILPASSTTKSILELTQGGQQSKKFGANESEERTAKSVIASLIAQGYVKGESLVNDMKTQALLLDEQVSFSQKTKLALHISRQKASEIDNNYQLTQKLNSLKDEAKLGAQFVSQELGKVGNDISKTLSGIDEKFHFKERASQAKDATIRTASDIYNKTMENETIKQTKDFVGDIVSSGWNSLVTTFSSFQQETKSEIEKQKNRSHSSEQFNLLSSPSSASASTSEIDATSKTLNLPPVPKKSKQNESNFEQESEDLLGEEVQPPTSHQSGDDNQEDDNEDLLQFISSGSETPQQKTEDMLSFD